MKKILSAVLIIIVSVNSFSQTNRIVVNIQTRDCEYMLSKSKAYDNWYTLDSALLAKGDSIANNAGTAPVTINGVPEKVWRDFLRTLRSDIYARVGNTVTRVDAALRALNITWLNNRMDEDEAAVVTSWTSGRQEGRKRARKENSISNQ